MGERSSNPSTRPAALGRRGPDLLPRPRTAPSRATGPTVSILLAAVMLSAALASPASAQAPAAISGRLVDAATGSPVEGARVEAVGMGLVTETAADGSFAIPAAGSGRLLLRVSRDGYEIATLEVTGPHAAPVEIRLARRPLRIYEEVVVAASRQATPVFLVPRAASVISGVELDRRQPRSTPEALMDAAGLLVQKTNHGSGSPYIRGLVGNQVLVLVDGVRLNNSTFRYGPNQYLATIDPASIERIEVVRGSGSVLHGSDALGGVINIVTRQPALTAAGSRIAGAVSGKVMSAGMERSGRAEAEVSGPTIAARGGLSVRRFGDLVAGRGLGVEAPSGYSEIAGDFGAVARLSRSDLLTVGFQHLRQSDVPRFDQVAQRGYSRYQFDPQMRLLGRVGIEHLFGGRWARSLSVTGSWHRSVEGRQRLRSGSTQLVTEEDVVGVAGLTAEMRSEPWPGATLVAGFDAYRDRIGSRRLDFDTETGAAVARRGLYPDGARASSVAAFAHLAWRRGPLDLEGGTRISRFAVSARDALFGELAIDPAAWVSSAAGSYAIAPGVRLIGSVAQAFRAPNVDDMSTLGAFDYGVEVPSTDLDPERSLAVDLGVRARLRRLAGSATLFRSDLDGLIDRVRSTLDGSATFEGAQVYRRRNVGAAYVQGAEVEAEWALPWSVVLFGHATYTYGQQTTAGQPMRRIPPANGLAGVRWESATGAQVEATIRAAAAQRRLSSGDRDDYRIAAGGTPGWTVVSVTAAWPLSAALEVTGSLHNLFDEAYRVHGSGIDGYGRSAWLGLRLRFDRAGGARAAAPRAAAAPGPRP